MKSFVTVIMGAMLATFFATSFSMAASCCDPAAAGAGINTPFPRTSGSPSNSTGAIVSPGFDAPLAGGVALAPQCGGRLQTLAAPCQSCCSGPSLGRPNMPQTMGPASIPVPNCCGGGALSKAARPVEAATPIARFTSASSSANRPASQSSRAVYVGAAQALNTGPFGKPGYFPGSSLW